MRNSHQANGSRDLLRLTISGGKRTEPRLVMMAHPMGETKRRRWLPVVIVIVAVIAIALVGSSR